MSDISTLKTSDLVWGLAEELRLGNPTSYSEGKGSTVWSSALPFGEVREPVRITAEANSDTIFLKIERIRSMARGLPEAQLPRMVASVTYNRATGSFVAAKGIFEGGSALASASQSLERFSGSAEEIAERMVRGVFYAADHLGGGESGLKWTSLMFSPTRRALSVVAVASFVGFFSLGGLLIARLQPSQG
ncbi:MAG: hypothetical protein HYW02_08760 [Deltaproteobacteria bacterium]|nr:hypothetical protein [Deltaproteobacteria bacterium]MBI2501528.1 hypothetical protein [Deltaproteobacteria bacterium]